MPSVMVCLGLVSSTQLWPDTPCFTPVFMIMTLELHLEIGLGCAVVMLLPRRGSTDSTSAPHCRQRSDVSLVIYWEGGPNARTCDRCTMSCLHRSLDGKEPKRDDSTHH